MPVYSIRRPGNAIAERGSAGAAAENLVLHERLPGIRVCSGHGDRAGAAAGRNPPPRHELSQREQHRFDQRV